MESPAPPARHASPYEPMAQSTPSDGGAGGPDRQRDDASPVELARSRENSVHGGSVHGAPSSMTPAATQLALYPMFFCEERHEASDTGMEEGCVSGGEREVVSKWRMKDRMKTMSVALILCLNIGVDPPDVLKISPCARMQCWINPLAMAPQKALEAIGKALQAQYERWQPRAKYKLQLDPTVEDVKKLCVSCRRNAKNERVLLHYNGHGVPRPTVNGEVWVFNKSYTQYIPLSVYDLQAWTGNPAIYVFDCSGAGLVVNSFLQLAEHGELSGSGGGGGAAGASMAGARAGGRVESAAAGRDGADRAPMHYGNEARAHGSRAAAAAGAVNGAGARAGGGNNVGAAPSGSDFMMGGAIPSSAGTSDCILLAACGADELLPQSAELPADVFSTCLTTPIKIALQWFCSRSILKGDGISVDIIDKIPGQQNNRKTPLGELNWIFTAITDTIAWNVLPRPLFQRLFRQDLLVASLFRNFLLAERIMRANNCTPISCPRLPPTYQHPMWHAWDMAVETCLLQMPNLISGDSSVEFIPSPFFTEQLTAFEVWLEHGSERKAPPEQLPIVLQVLLSQSHRLRALVLLGRFLDMGPWAVDLSLSVGIFPYVLKLLQTTAPDLRQILVFIWTKILALDRSCQLDLVKDSAHVYFIRFLDSPSVPSEERAMAAFVLAAIVDDHAKGQSVVAASGLMPICLSHLPSAASPAGSPLFVRWLCLCMGKLWENFYALQADAFMAQAAESIAPLLGHPTPDARAAAVYALGALIYVPSGSKASGEGDGTGTGNGAGNGTGTSAGGSGSDSSPNGGAGDAPSGFDDREREAAERTVACQILPGVTDASPLVRTETAVALGRLAASHSMLFQSAAMWWRRGTRGGGAGGEGSTVPQDSLRRMSSTLTIGSGSYEGGYLVNVGSQGSLGSHSMAGAGVYAASPKGPYEPAFATLGHRDPMSDQPEAGPLGEPEGEGDAESGVRNSNGNDPESGPSGTSPPGQSGGFASADAARVGGGLYAHLLERMVELAQDPSPRVSNAAQRALLATGLDPTHPLLKPVLSPAVLRASASATAAGAGGEGGGPGGVRSGDGLSTPAATRSREDLGAVTPLSTTGRTPSWSQKLSNAAARILRTPGRNSSSSLFSPMSGESIRENDSPGDGLGEMSGLQRSTSALRLMSPLAKMKRANTANVPLKGMASPRSSEQASFPPPFASMSEGESPRAVEEDGAEGGGRGGAGSVCSLLPKSHIFAWSCEHFSRSLLEPPAGAQEYDGGFEEDDEFYGGDGGGVSGSARKPRALHQRLDPNKRLARRRVVEDNARRSGRAKKESLKLTEQLASIEMESSTVPSCLIMHPLAPTATIADGHGMLRVWDYQTGQIRNKFHTGLPSRSIASLHLVNDLDDSLLLAGGVDGCVRVWRNYAVTGEQQLVTALRTLPMTSNAAPSAATHGGAGSNLPEPDQGTAAGPSDATGGSGATTPVGSMGALPTSSSANSLTSIMRGTRPPREGRRWSANLEEPRGHSRGVVQWQQQSGCLYAAGDTRPVPLLRVWDMTRELCLESLQMQSPGTCLTAEGALLMAGAADGAVLSFDLRTPARLLSAIQTHHQPVLSILLQPGSTSNLVVTGSVNGEMKFCDLRNAAKPFFTAEVQKPMPGGKSVLSALVGHSFAPVIASGSSERAIKLWDLEGNNVATIRYYNSFLGQRIGTIRSLAFHSNSLLLAAGSNDSNVTVYSGMGNNFSPGYSGGFSLY